MYRFIALLYFICISFTAGAKSKYVDYAKIVSQQGEQVIQNKLDELDAMGISAYLINLGKLQVSEVAKLALDDKKATYNIIIVIGYDHKLDFWTYEVATDQASVDIYDSLDQEMGAIFGIETDGGSKMDGTRVRSTFTQVIDWIKGWQVQVVANYGLNNLDNIAQAHPFLPVPSALEHQIDLFANYLEINAIPAWEQIRTVHTDTNSLKTMDYDAYVVAVGTFAQTLSREVNAFTDMIEATDIKTMYGQDLNKPIESQPFHLHSGGHDWWQDRYFSRARDLLRERLTAGKIPQMLRELAAMEYTFAYYYLDWLYELAGLSSELSVPLVQVVDTSRAKPFTRSVGANQYTIKGLAKATAGVNIPAVFARGGAGVKVELSMLEYENLKTGIKWDMLISCESGYGEGAVGVGSDFIKPSADVGVDLSPGGTLVGVDVNSSSTNTLHYYPPLFFRDPGYHYRSVAGEASLTSGDVARKIDYTIAGDVMYLNGDRSLGFSGVGLNASVGAGKGVGGATGDVGGNLQFKMEIGVGACQGFYLTYRKGLPKTLAINKNPFVAPSEEQMIKVVGLFFPSTSPALDQNDLNDLDRIAEDIKLFRTTWPEKTITVDIEGYSAGSWSQNEHPASIADPATLTGYDAATYANYASTKTMLAATYSSLMSLLGQKGVAITDGNGEVRVNITPSSDPVFIADGSEFQQRMRSEFPGRADEWKTLTASYRNVVVKLLGRE
jgi:hypothetical protein